jgi:hypothetical protein
MKRLRPIIKNLPEKLEHIKNEYFQRSGCSSIRLYAMDESRFGLLSIQRRCLVAKGVKPLVPYQHRFQNFYLFGAYSPSSGDHFTLELPKCNSECFQLWMDEFSRHRSEEFKIVILDNGAFHKSKDLKVPANIALLFLPPYSPELNPAEMIWRYLKDRIANTVFETLDKLSDALAEIINNLSSETIRSITGWRLYTDSII